MGNHPRYRGRLRCSPNRHPLAKALRLGQMRRVFTHVIIPPTAMGRLTPPRALDRDDSVFLVPSLKKWLPLVGACKDSLSGLAEVT